MNVIGHEDKGIQFSQREMSRDVLQTTPGNFAGIIQPHFSIYDPAEQAFPFPCAYCHRIGARLAMVGARRAVPLHEADGMGLRVGGHSPHYRPSGGGFF